MSGWTNQQAETITGLAFTYLLSTVLYSTGSALTLDSGATFTSETDLQFSSGAGLTLAPPAVGGHVYTPAEIRAQSDAGTGDAWLHHQSPSVDGGAVGSVDIYGANAAFPGPLGESLVNYDVGFLKVAGDALGGALVAYASSNAGSAAVAAETVVLTLPGYTYKAYHAYTVHYGDAVISSAASGEVNFRVRKTNAAGQLLYSSENFTCSPTATRTTGHQGVAHFQVGAADVTASLVLTLEAIVGTAIMRVGATGVRYAYAMTAGDSDQFAFAPTLV